MPDPDPRTEPSAPLLDDDYDEEWVNQAPRGLRVPGVIGVLLLALFAVAGFWGGAVLQKHHDKSSTATLRGGAAASGLAAAGAGRRGAAGGLGATGQGATGAGGSRTAGIVTSVQGSTVFLTDASGNLVKINLTPTSTITKSASATVADLQLGQNVTVTGTTGADGVTTAGSLTISPAGASGGAPGGG